MHDIRSFHVRVAFVWNVNGCLGAIACAFRWGETLVGNSTTGHCSSCCRKIISGTSGDGTHLRP